ncbi:7TM diverse intracellular signaling domain-containing protein [Pedobacter sp. P351]|uniref:sensor histidine kinase n=1 Tax=Pedobacter superstes TaxID=3133441 RepID=UPI0030B2763E
MKIFALNKKFLLSLSLIFLSTLTIKSQIVYNGEKDILSVGSKIRYYIDSSSSENIKSIQHQKNFILSKETVPDFGLRKVPMWLKVEITNKSNTQNLMIQFEQSFLQNIDFYYLEQGKYKVNMSGEVYPFDSRMINYHKFVYSLNIPKDSTITYYFRIKSILKMRMPISLGKKDSIVESNLTKNIWFGLFFGIILVMFFYNLFIYFVLKELIYLYYVAYIIIVGLVQTTYEGYSFQFLWPNNGFVAIRSFFVLTALVNIVGLEFVRKFLNTQNFIPRLDKVSYALYTVYILDIIFILRGDFFISYQIIQAFGGLMSLYILTVSIIIVKQGYRPAKFFLLAWIPLILSIIIWFLGDFNILPYNTFTNYSMTIGSAVEAILLSFALADKINIFKAEKEQSQIETLKALKETERIIREQNVVLEAKVKERTVALENSNSELNVTLDDLKQAQMQLVESEKMASLGQLTAGIAHEINNPINFVTSNVAPLQRDVNILMEAISTMENLNFSDSTIDEKKKQIEDYKEEIDYDYLKIEISHLLKGINEGASRTADIVKGLRVFSRLDEDDLKLANIHECLESTLVIANNLLTGIKVTKRFEDLPSIECYPGKLNQVFLNIISNAAHAINKKYTNTEAGELIISTSCNANHVIIEISDNGTGMDEYAVKKVFEPFFTTKDVGEGTGLGMSIAYNTIKKHNGQIILKSEKGLGTKFIIDLPIITK